MSMSWGDKQAMLIMPTDTDPPTGLVRDWIGSALTAVPELVRLRAALLTAELVDHARTYGLSPYVLHISLHQARRVLMIAVEDDLPTLGVGWPDRPGVLLLAGMSERWGVEYAAEGKTVWAELRLTEPGPLESAVDAAGDEGDLGES
ncbi:ATP-binding protein [Actinophytocola sp. KF-1]